MAEWVYKGTPTGANYDDTHDLAVFDRFLCRSAYERGADSDGLRAVGKVMDVAFGDVIHYYYRQEKGKLGCFGSFRVIDGSSHPSVFAACANHGALFSVLETPQNQKMVGRLCRGYAHDPRLEAFTGWVIEKLPRAHPTPPFDQAKMFPFAMTNLWQYPDPSLPRKPSRKKP